jgi:cephalosporin hydroxylase
MSNRSFAERPDPGDVVDQFHELYYTSDKRTWKDTRWLGTRASKCPLDLWVYQEILFERRPDLIVETGTARGGSALFLASVLDWIGSGRVITIDVRDVPGKPVHPRIEYRVGSSIHPDIVAGVRESLRPGGCRRVRTRQGCGAPGFRG